MSGLDFQSGGSRLLEPWMMGPRAARITYRGIHRPIEPDEAIPTSLPLLCTQQEPRRISPRRPEHRNRTRSFELISSFCWTEPHHFPLPTTQSLVARHAHAVRRIQPLSAMQFASLDAAVAFPPSFRPIPGQATQPAELMPPNGTRRPVNVESTLGRSIGDASHPYQDSGPSVSARAISLLSAPGLTKPLLSPPFVRCLA
ncbi:hypothetical protein QBC39DRAFT_63465 [Podospora conica]|nr:hypothetical protein QBC39DRAFT_63465 [Schizothecium conicum]